MFFPFFCSSGVGVACFCLFLRATEYEQKEANNFTKAYNNKPSSCIIYSGSVFLVLVVCRKYLGCWGYKDDPHISPALGVLSGAPAHVKPRAALAFSIRVCNDNGLQHVPEKTEIFWWDFLCVCASPKGTLFWPSTLPTLHGCMSDGSSVH